MPAESECGECWGIGQHSSWCAWFEHKKFVRMASSEPSPSAPESLRDALVDPSATEELEGPQIFDVVQKPLHYNSHPSGVECIQITEHMGYCLGNAIKYIWRADLKGKPIQDLKKAIFYIEREIAKREST